jgi:hypothetical protein
MGFSAIPISSLYPFLYFMVFYISFVLEAFKISLVTIFETFVTIWTYGRFGGVLLVGSIKEKQPSVY